MRTLHLKQGQCCIIHHPVKIVTILGSCLGIVMFDESTRLAGIAHCVLPSLKKGRKDDNPFMYVDYCLSFMKEDFLRRGSAPEGIEVGLYGGARMLGQVDHDTIQIGSKNIDVATKAIKEQGLRLLHYETGGTMGRKLIFFTGTGKVVCTELMKYPETSL